MTIEGYVDFTSHSEIRGWAYDTLDPDRSLRIEILADNDVLAVLDANLHRQDLQDAGKGNGKHAFDFHLADGCILTNPLQARLAGQSWFLQASGLPSRRSIAGIPRWHQTFQHTMEYGLPDVPYGFTETPKCGAAEVLLAERLIRAWQAASADDAAPKPKNDMWTEIGRVFHGSFGDILRRSDAPALAQYLSELYAKPVTHGIIQGEAATSGLEGSPAGAAFVATMFMDHLASLAEAVGVLSAESAEQLGGGRYGENLFENPDKLVNRISAAVGVWIIPPVVAGRMFGLRTGHGIVQTRDLCAVWAAMRIRDLMLGVKSPTVCEIGGGVGNVAYFAHKFGIRNYTIIDLPNINVVQSYCLIRALPETPIILQGEADSGGDAIRIMPPSRFGRNARYDLLLNQDSFPEMHPSVSLDYLRKARGVAGGFLSINQEARAAQPGGRQTVVQDIAAEAGGYRRVYRFPHWLRRGYVEEFYTIPEQRPIDLLTNAVSFFRRRGWRTR